MSTTWIYSDPHFGHANMVSKFVRADGVTPARPFASVEEMDEMLIASHNAHVRPNDIVWCLGDFALQRDVVSRVAPQLRGRKRLLLGNHDFEAAFYSPWFEDVRSLVVLNGIIFTHIPIAPWSFGECRANAHGHVHQNSPLVYRVDHPRGVRGFNVAATYINLSIERTSYRPVSLEEVTSWIAK